MSVNNGKKPRVGIMYFTSCGGCQCEILTLKGLLTQLVELWSWPIFPWGVATTPWRASLTLCS